MGDPVFQMLWDCRFCGAKKLLGLTHRHCPNCGAQADANARYFPADGEAIAVLDHVYVGSDLVCSACGTATSRAARHCGNCGAPLADAQGVALRGDQGIAGRPVGDRRTAPGSAHSVPPARKKRSVLVWIVPVGVFLLLGLAVVAGLLLLKKPGNFSVARNEWNRSVNVEILGPVFDSVWCDQLPFGAMDIHRHRETRSTKQVPDGQDCQTRKVDHGDGTYRQERQCTNRFKDEPVIDDKCDYRVERWHIERIEQAQGTIGSNVHWPDLKITRPGACVGCEREGAHSESYSVVFEDAQAQTFRCDFPAEKWSTFAPGTQYNGAIRALARTLDCDSLTKR